MNLVHFSWIVWYLKHDGGIGGNLFGTLCLLLLAELINPPPCAVLRSEASSSLSIQTLWAVTLAGQSMCTRVNAMVALVWYKALFMIFLAEQLQFVL